MNPTPQGAVSLTVALSVTIAIQLAATSDADEVVAANSTQAADAQPDFEKLVREWPAVIAELQRGQQANDAEKLLTASERYAAHLGQLLLHLAEGQQVPGLTLEQSRHRLNSILRWLAERYADRDDFERAEQSLQECLELHVAWRGREHWQTFDVRRALGDLRRVRSLSLQQRQAVREARRVGLLAARLYRQGRFAEALRAAIRCAQLRKGTLGDQHGDYAQSLNNLAALYESMGEYAKAEPLYVQARDIWKEALGEEHPQYATSLNNLAALYESMGEYAKAEPLYVQARDIRKEALGNQHPQYAQSLNNLAGLYQSMGEYAKAEPLYVQARDIRKQTLSEQHPDYAASLNNLAALYQSMGANAKAEPLLVQAVDIWKQALGRQHPDYAASLNNLAALYQSMGAYAKAEPLYVEARDLRKQVLGEQHPEYAQSLHNLAWLYQSTGEYAKAEALLVQAREIKKRLLGEQHPSYATSLNNLAVLYQFMGEYSKAEPLYVQVAEIRRRILGEQHPHYATSLHNLAWLYESMGEYAKAEPLCVQACEIKEKVLGEQHPDYAASLYNLAAVYLSTGEYAKAEQGFREAHLISLSFARLTAATQSEAAAKQLLETQWLGPDAVFSLRRLLPGADLRETYGFAWEGRGLLTQILSERRRSLAGSAKSRAVQGELGDVARQLAQLTLAVVPAAQAEARQKRLRELNDRKEELERELARLSAEYRRELDVEQAAPADLLRRLPGGTALVDVWEITVSSRLDGTGRLQGRREYEAFILRRIAVEPGWSVAWIHLGPAEPINAAVTEWLALIQNGEDGLADDPAGKLRDTIWEPVESHLEGIEHVIILPDSVLCFLPWAALPGRRPGSVLLEDYLISTALSGQELYRQLTEPTRDADEPSPHNSGGLLLVGGVRYDAQGEAPARPLPEDATLWAGRSRSIPRAAGQQGLWGHLAGSMQEAEDIARIWPYTSPPTLLTETRASEAALRQSLPEARYIHVATHGFFADPQFRSFLQHDPRSERLFAAPGIPVPGGSGRPDEFVSAARRGGSVTGRNPLLLSGLVLAGANLPQPTDDLGLPTGDDGILTAEEIVNLDLRHAELVVLSACDTGLGTERGGGEGVFGLQRAFHLTGARNVIASLWKVDDESTAALMKVFYENLWTKKKPPIEALRDAQLAIRRHPEQIPVLARSRGPDFSKTVELVSGPGKDKADTPGENGRRAPIRQWAAFTMSGPGT